MNQDLNLDLSAFNRRINRELNDSNNSNPNPAHFITGSFSDRNKKKQLEDKNQITVKPKQFSFDFSKRRLGK
jgi:hypothetical protein